MKQIQIYQIETNTDLSIDLIDLIHESDRYRSCRFRSYRDLIDPDLIEI